MKFRINVRGQQFDIEADSIEDVPAKVDEILLKQQAQRTPFVTGEGITPRPRFTGEIRGPRTLRERITEGLPAFGQFAGGLTGGAVTSRVTPSPTAVATGAGVGGVGGRGLGLMGQSLLRQAQREPIETTGRLLTKGPFGVFEGMTPEEKELFKEDITQTAKIEGTFVPIGLAFNTFGKRLFKGIGDQLFGPEVMEQFRKKGISAVLNPKHFKGRLDKNLAVKSSQFFDKARSVTGKRVEKAVSKVKEKINFNNIRQETESLFDKGSGIDDIEASDSQKKFLERMTLKVMLKNTDKQGNLTANSLWNLRRELDVAAQNKILSAEARQYFNNLRGLLNNPLRDIDDQVARSFDAYAFVRNAEGELSRNFEAIQVGKKGGKGEIFAPKIESFASNLLKTDKQEKVRLIQGIDEFLRADEKVVEDLLLAAASETIDKPIALLGILSRIAVGAIGGKRSIAKFGEFLQSRPVGAVKSFTGRSIPVSAVEATTAQPSNIIVE